jgi:hypothetical protein
MKSVGVHWGTFRLTYEHYLEPKQKIEDLVRAAGVGADGKPGAHVKKPVSSSLAAWKNKLEYLPLLVLPKSKLKAK